MNFMASFDIVGSGLSVQRTRLDVIASNLANAETTRTPEGGPYKRKAVVLAAASLDGFSGLLADALRMVKVEEIVEDGKVKRVYDPAHPDADKQGFVARPDINPLIEMADMITTARNYEAIVTAFDATKNMALKTLDMGK